MDKRRTYVQTARAASTQATRERILEAAEASFERGPLAAVRIDDVARRAGVSRSTVYQLFESRARAPRRARGPAARAGGLRPARGGSQHPDARESFRLALRESCRMFAVIPDLTRALFTLAGLDADAVAAVGAARARAAPGHAAAGAAARGAGPAAGGRHRRTRRPTCSRW